MKFNDAIYVLENRKRYWQEKLRTSKARGFVEWENHDQAKINEIDKAIKILLEVSE